MPSGCDDVTDRMGARSFTRNWRVKLVVLAVFITDGMDAQVAAGVRT